MRNIKLTIEYDGTCYAGWQRQKNASTVTEKIEEAIFQITGEKVEIIGASRTDAGVHAKGYVGNFNTVSKIPAEKFADAINSKLPEDIIILNAEEVPLEFHARYDSRGKTYSYVILNREKPSAIERRYVYHVKQKLDLYKMIKASRYLVGKHDFASFKNTGSSVKTSIRTITQLDIVQEGDKIKFIISADGFLYNMVRIIVGTLLKAGMGEIEPSDVELIIKAKDRKKAGKTVPATGLCLEMVYY